MQTLKHTDSERALADTVPERAGRGRRPRLVVGVPPGAVRRVDLDVWHLPDRRQLGRH